MVGVRVRYKRHLLVRSSPYRNMCGTVRSVVRTGVLQIEWDNGLWELVLSDELEVLP